MDPWRRLRSEPARLRTAIARRSHRQLAAIARRLTAAVNSANGTNAAARYERLATLAVAYNVHAKTLGRWLEEDAPGALLKRTRLTLVDKKQFADWEARQTRAPGGRR